MDRRGYRLTENITLTERVDGQTVNSRRIPIHITGACQDRVVYVSRCMSELIWLAQKDST